MCFLVFFLAGSISFMVFFLVSFTFCFSALFQIILKKQLAELFHVYIGVHVKDHLQCYSRIETEHRLRKNPRILGNFLGNLNIYTY